MGTCQSKSTVPISNNKRNNKRTSSKTNNENKCTNQTSAHQNNLIIQQISTTPFSKYIENNEIINIILNKRFSNSEILSLFRDLGSRHYFNYSQFKKCFGRKIVDDRPNHKIMNEEVLMERCFHFLCGDGRDSIGFKGVLFLYALLEEEVTSSSNTNTTNTMRNIFLNYVSGEMDIHLLEDIALLLRIQQCGPPSAETSRLVTIPNLTSYQDLRIHSPSSDVSNRSQSSNGQLISFPENFYCAASSRNTCGLDNLGNSCHLSTAVQILRHLFFMKALTSKDSNFLNELNVDNVLGTGGLVTRELVGVCRALVESEFESSKPKPIKPIKLVNVLSKSMGENMNEQQDGQEVLSYLLDALHEDLNRKPSVVEDNQIKSDAQLDLLNLKELATYKWQQFSLRNHSIISKCCMGQTLLLLNCAHCHKQYRNFDSFSILPLPIPQTGVLVECLILRKYISKRRQDAAAPQDSNSVGNGRDDLFVKYYLCVPRMASVAEVKEQISTLANIPSQQLMLCAMNNTSCMAAPKTSNNNSKDQESAPISRVLPFSAVAPLVESEGALPCLQQVSKSKLIAFETTLSTTKLDEAYVDAQRISEIQFSNPDILNFQVGQRVDAADRNGKIYTGSVAELLQNEKKERHIVIHFDLFSHKWDEIYNQADINTKLFPLYSKSKPKYKLREFLVTHRLKDYLMNDNEEKMFLKFGQTFILHFHHEWTTARAGAHILDQAKRFLYKRVYTSNYQTNTKVQRTFENARKFLNKTIQLLLQYDYNYTKKFEISTFESLNKKLLVELEKVLKFLPFEVRVYCKAQNNNDVKSSDNPTVQNDEVEMPFPFTLNRFVGNFFNPRSEIILHWRTLGNNTGENFEVQNSTLYYFEKPSIHEESRLKYAKLSGPDESNDLAKRQALSVTLESCLGEFCRQQHLSTEDGWHCSKCKQIRSADQTSMLWKLPDVLIFNIKRFTYTSRWREKNNTKVDFPLKNLDMTNWCHNNIGTNKSDMLYDLVGVMNHSGGLTGGHYIAMCKRNWTRDNSPTQSETSSGGGCVSDNDESTCPSDEEENVDNSHRMDVTQSNEEDDASTWFQFDDDVVDKISPKDVVTQSAYVLFYRRRNLTPSNVAEFCTFS